MKRLLLNSATVLALAIFLAGTPAAYAQGCSLCNQSAQAASSKGRAALNRGIVVLLVPPVGMMTALLGYAFWRSRNDN
jgi:hypothetical protein